MNPSLQIYLLASVALVTMGIIGVFAARDVVRKLLALNITGAGIFLLLVALAGRRPDGPPDPVPHAMVLTGIVVAESATALALALARRVAAAEQDAGTADDGDEDA